jgi:lipopolysaccharide export LptBFGC system permease protein LptF
MSRTLFHYIFWDLVKIFLLTTGALAGIMSFAGLLRPLTQHGLDGRQVAEMLAYFMPAMTTYSLPIAAIFATTMIYGRLGSDNEITAMRAAGISPWMVLTPAFVGGLLVALLSIGLLSFLVPAATLKVEQVIYSNLAKLVSNEIDRTRRIDFDQDDRSIRIYADTASVQPSPEGTNDQVVRMDRVLITSTETVRSDGGRMDVPVEFYSARTAWAYLTISEGEEPVVLRVVLDGGTKFPARTTGGKDSAVEVSIGATQFGPWQTQSPIRENTKFMDILRLYRLLDHPEESSRISALLNEFVRTDMRTQYLHSLALAMNEGGDEVRFETGRETYVLTRVAGKADEGRRDKPTDRLVIGDDTRPSVRLRQIGGSFDATARQAIVKVWPDLAKNTLAVSIELRGAVLALDGEMANRGNGLERSMVIPMPEPILKLKDRRLKDYRDGKSLSVEQRARYARETLKHFNGVYSEIHARLSFAVSCVVLVLVGCCLGMTFKSGNFLSAFAVSSVPALISIVLIVSGQHTAENIPAAIGTHFQDPRHLGVAMIWSGNAAVACIAAGLVWRLSKQ